MLLFLRQLGPKFVYCGFLIQPLFETESQHLLLLAVDILDTSILSGLIFGLISVIVPWFFYLPVTGKGFMGNKTPNPTLTKLLSTSSHVVVGIFLAIGFSFLGY